MCKKTHPPALFLPVTLPALASGILSLYLNMVVVSILVDYLDGYLSSKWPLQVVIKLTFHEVGVDRHMSSFSITISLRKYVYTELIAVRMCVKWRQTHTFFTILSDTEGDGQTEFMKGQLLHTSLQLLYLSINLVMSLKLVVHTLT